MSQLDQILSNFDAGEARSSALGTSAADAAEGIAEAEATLREIGTEAEASIEGTDGREDGGLQPSDRSLDHQMDEIVDRADGLARQFDEDMEQARNGSFA